MNTEENTNASNNINRATATTGNGDDYTAKRTATEGTVMGMSSTMWTWIIFGILGISIISLVWYYSMQESNKQHHEN